MHVLYGAGRFGVVMGADSGGPADLSGFGGGYLLCQCLRQRVVPTWGKIGSWRKRLGRVGRRAWWREGHISEMK